MHIRFFIVISFFFHSHLTLPVDHLKFFNLGGIAYAQEKETSNDIYDEKNQSTDLDLSKGSTAGDFAKSLLTTLTMLVIGLVGIKITKYSSIANDSKIFAIGAIIYFVGEVVSLIQAGVEIFGEKQQLDEKSENLQIETLQSMKNIHEKKSKWLLARAGLQTAALTAFGTATGYSIKLYVDAMKRLKETQVKIKAGIAEQKTNLSKCQAKDPSMVLVSQPGAAPGAIGLPYYSVLCPQTITAILHTLKDALTKVSLDIKSHNTIFHPEGSGATIENERIRHIRFLDIAQNFLQGARKALKIESKINEDEVVQANNFKLENESFLKELEKKVEQHFFNLLKEMEANAGPSGINYLSQATKSLGEADRALATGAVISELELSAENNLYVSLAQTTLNVTKLEDKIAVSIATNTASLLKKGMTRAAATRLAQTTVVKGVANALVKWLAPRVTAMIASSAAAAAIPGIGWIAGATNVALGAYTIYGLWDAFSQTSHWRDIKKSLYAELERQGYGDIVDWLESSIFHLPGAPCYYYPNPSPLIDPAPKCDPIAFDLFPLRLKNKNIYQINSAHEVIAAKHEAQNWSEKLMNSLLPKAKASGGLFQDLGIKAGGIAVIMIFRKKLMLLMDDFLPKPLGRSIVHGSISALTTAVLATTINEYKREKQNVKKIEQLIKKLKNESSPGDAFFEKNETTQILNKVKVNILQVLEKFFPKAISQEEKSNLSISSTKKTPCFFGRIKGQCRSFQKQIAAVAPIHKNILDKRFYRVVQNTAKIGDGLSNSQGITPRIGALMEQLNKNQPYIARLNKQLESRANKVQANSGVRVVNFEKEQKSFLEKIKKAALDSIKEAGIDIDEVVKLIPGFSREASEEVAEDLKKKSSEKQTKGFNDSTKSQEKVAKERATKKNNLDDQEYEYKGVEIIKNKEISIFKIISKRYMIKFSEL